MLQELKIIPESYQKHIQNSDGLYKIRIKQGSDIFRIFCFFDNEKIVVLMNGFQKNTKK
ncbi:type II toxin-antitoxin system RelE/ParE family toxin [Dyadobacter frigoris]|uniref:type II toxin-antitoxin system RelE/ParE family toxin n=1 Tax=Dyadobacter frigoris TaxID=2576211 RepID=UPI00286E3F5F|nr:type II toxin-antitoxin system RelE/ParE family toxin [Dyadobacter frigoris]